MSKIELSLAKTPSITEVFSRMEANKDLIALFWEGKKYSYATLFEKIAYWDKVLQENQIEQGTICAFQGDYSPMVCGLIFSLIKKGVILVPFTDEISNEIDSFLEISCAEIFVKFSKDDTYSISKVNPVSTNPLISKFLETKHPGLIVFTSGSTGKPKGILHDCEYVMSKFVVERQGWKTVLFLLMDHFGGFNTLLSTFAYLGTGICVPNRTPHDVAKAIQDGKANLLPTTPTFLNLMIANKIEKFYDLSSMELISYGTELMSQTTLEQVNKMFPKVRVKQTYGLSEQGVLHSKSEKNDSTWLKVGGPGFETKIIDNILWIKSKSNMVGYLNAPNPFDKDGWLCTGDEVEVNGEYIRFKGRKTEIINVGGKKVYPIEVENILLKVENVKDASVFAKSHEIMGQIVHANITTNKETDNMSLIRELRVFCNANLPRYKVPVKFNISVKDDLHNARFKKSRNL
jgi:acyl-coenzyme A synthetase/AMP-(fatty) acid ligase